MFVGKESLGFLGGRTWARTDYRSNRTQRRGWVIFFLNECVILQINNYC